MKSKLITLLSLAWTMCAPAQSQYAGIYGGTVNDTTFSDPNAGIFAVFVGTNGLATVVGYDIDSFNNYNSGQAGGLAAQFNVPANGSWNFSSNNTIYGVSGSGVITNGTISGTLTYTNGDTVALTNGYKQSPLGSFQNAAGYYSGSFSGTFGGQPASGPLMGVLSPNGQVTFSVFVSGALNDGGQGQLGSNNKFTTTNATSGSVVSGTLTNATLKIGGIISNPSGSGTWAMSRSNYVFGVATTNLPAGVTTMPYRQTLAAYGGPTNFTWGIISGGLPAGLSLSGAGVISGTPTTAVTTNFTVRATNALSATATQALSFVIYAFATNATFTVSPLVVSNTYPGTITLVTSNLAGGETVVVQKYLDLNTNSVIDAGDWLVQQFNLTDGRAGMVIGGVTNFNVPGDWNPAAGVITTTMNFKNGDFMQNIVGKYLYKLSSSIGHFAPITNVLFTVTNASFAQTIKGTVVSNGVAIPNASVLLFPWILGQTGPISGPTAGVIANISGLYSIAVPTGTYGVIAFKSNYVCNFATPVIVTLTNSQTISNNLTLTNSTVSISGTLVDAGNSNLKLRGILLPIQADNGFMGIGFTDTNGNFTVRVSSGQWNVRPDDPSLIVHGYPGLNNGITVDTTTGNVANVTIALPQATSLIYGSVKDNLGNPFVGLDVYASDTGNLYQADAYTDANGNYVLGVLGLGSDVYWWMQANGSLQLTNYVFSQETINGNISAGQAVLQNFTAILATNYIIGRVKDNNGNPIAGVGVNANATINGTNYQTHADTDAGGNYWLNVASTNWSVSVNCNGGSDSLSSLGNYICPNNQTITISNNNGLANFTVQTNINAGGPLQVTTAALPGGAVGQAYDQQLTADGGNPNPTYSWSVYSGALPSGLAMDSGGTIQGKPTFGGTNQFTVQVSDNNGSTATQALSLTIGKLALGVPVWLSNQFQMWLTGATNQNYTVQVSINLNSTNWTTLLMTNNAVTNSFILVDPSATNKQGFYRIVTGP